MVKLRQSVTGRLRDAYPVNAHDVEVQVTEELPPDRLAEILARTAHEVLGNDPRCRRVVFAVPVDDLTSIAAAHAAGFRYVVDVDIPGEELSLLVAEPHWVTAIDSDRVPGT